MTKEELNDLKDEVQRMARGQWDAILSSLAPQLQPALDRLGRHVPCPVHGGKDGFRVFKDVDATGGSVCNTCGINHDGIATLMWANGWRYGETLRAVADYLRVGIRAMKPTRKAVAKSEQQPGDEEENKRLRQALNRVWNESISILDRDAEPARLYLARRGISIAPPESLRFHPSLSYYDGDKKIGEFPAIVAMVSGAQGNPVTIHRTYLTQDGKKAPVESPKKLMGYPKDRKIVGGAIRLVDPGPILAVAEGLETALAVMEGMELPVWSAVNALMLENFTPPASVERVLVFADKDRSTEQHPKGHGQEAARNLVQRLWGMGIKASAIVPAGDIPSGQKSLDWLDILNRDGVAGFPSIQSIDAHLMRRAA
jgi:hypothetical protein